MYYSYKYYNITILQTRKQEYYLWYTNFILLVLQKFTKNNTLRIPESFNANISHQLFDYTITFMNSQH